MSSEHKKNLLERWELAIKKKNVKGKRKHAFNYSQTYRLVGT